MFKDYAFIIGINDYASVKEEGLGALNAAITDAQDFERWFTEESDKGSRERCYTVYSKKEPLEPLQHQIDDKLQQLFDQAQNEPEWNRRLFFYFAGHGFGVDLKPTINALCLANWSERKRNAALSSLEYHDVIINYRLFRQVVIFLDCCRNIKDTVIALPSTLTAVPADIDYRTEVFWGYAAQHTDRGYEITTDTGEKKGIFSSVLMKGLRGAAANDDGIISSTSLKNYLDMQVPALASKNNVYQKPDIINGLTETDAIFGQVPADKLVDCIISIKPDRGRPVVLLNGLGDPVKEIVDPQQTELRVGLKKGLYLLKDLSGTHCQHIEVNTRINEKKPDYIVVNF